MKKGLKILIGIVVVIVIIVLVALYFTGRQTKMKEITFGEDKIRTVYAVVGEKRKVTGVSYEKSTTTDAVRRTVTYKEGVVTEQDITDYVTGLREDGFLITVSFENYDGQLGMESKDEGKIVLVDIEYDKLGETVITYTKGTGTITKY